MTTIVKPEAGAKSPDQSDTMWLARRYFDESSTQFRTVWDLYIKFYTVFLTVQIAGLAATVQYIDPGNRTLIVIAFVVQNVLSGITAIRISYYSMSTEAYSRRLASLIGTGGVGGTLPEVLSESPFPARVAFWSGWANAIAHVAFVACWITALWIPLVTKAG